MLKIGARRKREVGSESELEALGYGDDSTERPARRWPSGWR